MESNQLLVFLLNDEEYGVSISYAQEIIRIPVVSKIPGVPSYVKGVVRLRDKVIPVIDLKCKLGLGFSEKHDESRLIVFNIGESNVGIIVDDVSEVLHLDEKFIEKFPSELSGFGNNCLDGIGKIDDRLLLLLDVKKALTEDCTIIKHM